MTELPHKTSVNQPCPCHSGKKYKHCCRKKDNKALQTSSLPEQPPLSSQNLPKKQMHQLEKQAESIFALQEQTERANAWLMVEQNAQKQYRHSKKQRNSFPKKSLLPKKQAEYESYFIQFAKLMQGKLKEQETLAFVQKLPPQCLSSKLLQQLCIKLLQEEQLESVKQLLSRLSIEQEPFFTLAQHLYSLKTEQNQGKLHELSLLYTSKLKAQPKAFQLLWAKALYQAQQLNAAQKIFLWLWQDSKNKLDPNLGVWIASVYITQNQLTEAEPYLAQVFAEQKTPPLFFWWWRSLLYQKQEKYIEASTDAERLFKDQPQDWSFEHLLKTLLAGQRYLDANRYLNENKKLTKNSMPCTHIQAILAWQRQDFQSSYKALSNLKGEWLKKNNLQQHIYQWRTIAAFEGLLWKESLEACEEWEQLLDKDESKEENEHSERNLYPKELLQLLRREAIKGLLTSQSSSTRVKNERLLSVEKEYLAQMLQAVLGSKDSKKKTSKIQRDQWQKKMEQLRENYLDVWSQSSEKQRKKLLQKHIISFEQLLSTQPEQEKQTNLIQQSWGKALWLRLSDREKALLLDAESLFLLFQKQPEQDHAAILFHWTRVAEDLLNKHLVDPMLQFAVEQLAIDLSTDLPKLQGKRLQSSNNQLSLGSIPYLFNQQWNSPKPSKNESQVQYNHLVTSAQKELWQAYRLHLKSKGVSEQLLSYLFGELASTCSHLAQQRNQAAHSSQKITRLEASHARQRFLFGSPNLYTLCLQIPK